MNRKRFVEILSVYTGAIATVPLSGLLEFHHPSKKSDGSPENSNELSADVIICGGGLGGCAAALSALRNNLNVILTLSSHPHKL
jgi:NADPH-dependent 2,4-dienoyl-CoA reductase/sulfur reductase-like enzyme